MKPELIIASVLIACIGTGLLMRSCPQIARRILIGITAVLFLTVFVGLAQEYQKAHQAPVGIVLIIACLLVGIVGYILLVRSPKSEFWQVFHHFSRFMHPGTITALITEGPDGRLGQDGKWAVEHEPELMETYGGQWIAVVDRKIISSAKTAEEAWANGLKINPARMPFVRRISTVAEAAQANQALQPPPAGNGDSD